MCCELKSCLLTTSPCNLQDSEGRELELAAKTAGKHAEQAELAGRVADCQAKVEAKLQDLRAVADAKQQVWTNILPPLASTVLLVMIETSAEDSMCMHQLSIDWRFLWEAIHRWVSGVKVCNQADMLHSRLYSSSAWPYLLACKYACTRCA